MLVPKNSTITRIGSYRKAAPASDPRAAFGCCPWRRRCPSRLPRFARRVRSRLSSPARLGPPCAPRPSRLRAPGPVRRRRARVGLAPGPSGRGGPVRPSHCRPLATRAWIPCPSVWFRHFLHLWPVTHWRGVISYSANILLPTDFDL